MRSRSSIKKPYPALLAAMLQEAYVDYGVLYVAPRKENGKKFYVYHPRDNVRVEVSPSFKGALRLLRLMREEEAIKQKEKLNAEI